MSKGDAIEARSPRRCRLLGFVGSLMVCGSMLVSGLAAQVTQPDDSTLQNEVSQALVDLGADSLSARETAERKLLEIGPAALAYLERPSADESPEKRERWERVRQQLEKVAAEEAVAPTRVSLSGSWGPDETLGLIAEATGNAFESTQSDQPAVAFELADVTYWEAIDAWLNAFRERRLAVPRGADGRLRTTAAVVDETMPPSASAGAFRVEVVRLEALKDFSNPDLDGTVVTARIRWEPRLRPVTITHDLERLEALAGEHRLRSRMGISAYESSVVPARGGVDVRWVLDPLPRSEATLERLSGVMRVRVPTRPTEIQFSLASESLPAQQRVGGTLVSLHRVESVEDSWLVHVRVRFDDAQGTLESHRGWFFDSPVALICEAGEAIKPLDYETDRQADNEVGMVYRFPKSDTMEPLHFRIEIPAAIVSTEIPFEIRSIPLP